LDIAGRISSYTRKAANSYLLLCTKLLLTPPKTPLKLYNAANNNARTIITSSTAKLKSNSAKDISTLEIISLINIRHNKLFYC
jgi:hypothetical protein